MNFHDFREKFSRKYALMHTQYSGAGKKSVKPCIRSCHSAVAQLSNQPFCFCVTYFLDDPLSRALI